MAEYYVLLRRGQAESSDAAVNSVPVTSTKITAPVEFGSLVKVEASSATAAVQAARAAYPGRANSKSLTFLESNVTEA